MKYDTYNDKVSDGKTSPTAIVRDGKIEQAPSRPRGGTYHQVPGNGINIGGIQLSPAQARAHIGDTEETQGMTDDQWLRHMDLNQALEDHAYSHQQTPSNEQADQPAERPAKPSPRGTPLGKALGIGDQSDYSDPTNLDLETIDEDGAKAVSQLQESVSSGDQETLLAHVIDGDELSDNQTADLLRKYGLTDPSQLTENLNHARDALEGQFDRYVSLQGLDGEAVRDWIEQNIPERDRGRFAREHFHSSDPTAWNEAIDAYIVARGEANPDETIEALQAAGLNAYWNGQEIVVNTPEVGQVPYRTALKHGFIKASYSVSSRRGTSHG